MKALILEKPGTPYKLTIGDVPMPKPKAGEVRLRVEYVSLNPVDYKFARGGDSLTFPHILGVDAAGTIDEVGPGITQWKKGDRVAALMNLLRWGSFAEFAVADAHILSTIPNTLSLEAASTIPCAGITAWQAIYEKLHLKKGQTVLITAGSGGVGGFAIQMAHNLGATVFTTASQEPDRLTALGATHVINYQTDNITEKVMDLTQGKGIDAIIDLVSESSSGSLLPVLRHNGQLASVAGRVDNNPTAPWAKAISFHEVALGFAYQHGDSDNLQDIARGGTIIADQMAQGTIDPMITSRIDMAQIPNGLKALEEGHVKGKIVVSIS